MLNLIKFYLYRKFNRVPCREEIKSIAQKHPYLLPNYKYLKNTKKEIVEQYINGASIDVISRRLNLTRERVRQSLYYLYVDSKNKEKINQMKYYESRRNV